MVKKSLSKRSRLSFRERTRKLRREIVLEAATKEFGQAGCFNFTMDEVARSAGVAKGVLYAHFPSKEHFLKRVLKRREALVLLDYQRRKRLTTVPASIEQRLASIAEILLNEENWGAGYAAAPLRRLACCLENCGQPQGAGKLHKIVRRVIEEGQAAGELAAALPASMLAGLFLDITLSQSVRAVANPRQGANLAAAIFLHGSKGLKPREVSYENRDNTGPAIRS